MVQNIKIVIAAVSIVVILFIGSISAMYINLSRERAEKATLREKLAEVMKERKRLLDESDELRLIKIDLETKLSGIEAEAKIISENYEKEKSQNDIVRLELSKKAEELKKFEASLKSAIDEKEAIQAVLDAEKAKYNELKERVDKLVEVKDVLEDKVRNIVNKQGIELERIVVKAEGALEGKVVVVNRDYNFVVADIGLQDGIEPGDFLTIFRGGKFAGEVRVEKIYDSMSAATIIKEIKPNAITVGDNVIVRQN